MFITTKAHSSVTAVMLAIQLHQKGDGYQIVLRSVSAGAESHQYISVFPYAACAGAQ
jgi:hypothetical protein